MPRFVGAREVFVEKSDFEGMKALECLECNEKIVYNTERWLNEAGMVFPINKLINEHYQYKHNGLWSLFALSILTRDKVYRYISYEDDIVVGVTKKNKPYFK